MDDNDIIRSCSVLGVKPESTVTEIRDAYLRKTSQNQFLKVFISDEELVNDFKRYHTAYVNAIRGNSERDRNPDLSLYPPDQAFRLVLNQGIYFLITQNYIKAGEKFQEAFTMNRSSDEIHVYLGLILLLRKNYYAAEKYFMDAVKINRENEDIWFFLGETYYKAGKPSKALNMYETAKKLNPLRMEISERIKEIKGPGAAFKSKTPDEGSFLSKLFGKIKSR